MQRIDDMAIGAYRIPRLLLMEHAGFALAQAVRGQIPDVSALLVVCCGTGYNGGDGLAATRHLLGWGYRVRVILTGRFEQLREEPAVYAGILSRMQAERIELTGSDQLERCQGWLHESGAVIDALLGIGLQGSVREPIASLIQRINESGKPVIAADIPSGLDGDAGEPHGIAVRASVTVAFAVPKRGCFEGQGPMYAGDVLVAPIGIPPEVLEAA